MFVFGPNLNPQRPPDITGDNPIVGINNLVTSTNVDADYELSTNPATNLANPSTALTWKSGANGLQYLTIDTTGVDPIDYFAVAGHNFGTAVVPVNVQGWLGDYVLGSSLRAYDPPLLSENLQPLLTEAGGQLLAEGQIANIGDMTAGGGLAAAFDNTTNQAIAASAQTTGAVTSGYVGSDLSGTITSGVQGKRIFKAIIFGSNDQGFVSASNPTVTLNLYGKTGSTPPANATDGTLLGTLAFTDTANESGGRTITSTDQATRYSYVWVQVSVGVGATLDVAEAQFFESLENWFDLTAVVTPTDNLPMFFRFNKQAALQKIRLQMAISTGNPQASVVYTGVSLVFQRRVYVGHTPLNMGRVTNIVTGMSESGNYLGRIVLSESRKTEVALQNIDPVWYRANLEPFISSAITVPFFFAWRPGTYPNETGFAWLSTDAVPVNQLANGFMSLTLPLVGVAS